jgi:predicted ABC-type ATPase
LQKCRHAFFLAFEKVPAILKLVDFAIILDLSSKKPEINSSSSGSQITEMFYITTLQINFIKKYYFIFYAM